VAIVQLLRSQWSKPNIALLISQFWLRSIVAKVFDFRLRFDYHLITSFKMHVGYRRLTGLFQHREPSFTRITAALILGNRYYYHFFTSTAVSWSYHNARVSIYQRPGCNCRLIDCLIGWNISVSFIMFYRFRKYDIDPPLICWTSTIVRVTPFTSAPFCSSLLTLTVLSVAFDVLMFTSRLLFCAEWQDVCYRK